MLYLHMRMTFFLAATLLATTSTAMAQDVVVMRRQLAQPVPAPSTSPTPTPTPGSTPTPTPTPGSTPTPTPGVTPAPTPTPAPGYTGTWLSGSAVSDGPACSANAPATRTVKCTNASGDELGAAQCDPATKPSTVVTIEDLRSCTSQWKTGGWSTENSTTCGSWSRFRDIWCERSDGSVSGAYSGGHQCDMAAMPDRSETVVDHSTCTYRWDYGVYGNWDTTCSATAKRTRPVNGCLRIETVEMIPPAEEGKCTAAKDTTETTALYTGCTYTATAYGPWSTCVNGKRTAQPTACQRSDTTMVATSFCSAKEETSCTPRTCSTNFVQYKRTLQQSDNTLSAASVIRILPNNVDWKNKAAEACSAHTTDIIACFVNHLPDGRVNVLQHKTTPTIIANSTAETHWTSVCTAN